MKKGRASVVEAWEELREAALEYARAKREGVYSPVLQAGERLKEAARGYAIALGDVVE